MMSLVALGGLTSSGVAIAVPDDQPLPSPAEPNVPPPAQPDAPPTNPQIPTTPSTPGTPAPSTPTTPQVPAQPATPAEPATPTATPSTTPSTEPTEQPAPTAAAVTPTPTTNTVIVPTTERYHEYGYYQPVLASGIGVAVTVGGGLFGFTDRSLRQTTSSDVGGAWDLHASFGTHIPIGIEVAYSGNAENIQSLAGTPNGTLVGTAAEGDLRYTILPHSAWTPFAFIGIGWQRFDVTSERLAAADTGLKTHDDVADFPMGAGLSFRDVGGFTFDLRGTFRADSQSSLLRDPRTGEFADLHSWEASAALGYEF